MLLSASGLMLGNIGCGSVEIEASLSADETSDGLWSYSLVSQTPAYSSSGSSFSDCTISFFIRPENAAPGTVLFEIRDGENWVSLTTSGYNDGVYSGLTLSSSQGEWLVADGVWSLSSGRYNQVAVTLSNRRAVLYLNGDQAAEGEFHNPCARGTLTFGGQDEDTAIQGRLAKARLSGVRTAETIAQEYEEQRPAIYLDTISFPESDDQIHDLWLLDQQIGDIPVTYTVSENPYMDYRGIILKRPQEDTEVTLTAVMSTETASATKTFVIHLLADNDVNNIERDCASLDADIPGVVFSGQALPTVEQAGSTVTYRLLEGDAVLAENCLRINSESERVSVKLEAELTLGSEKRTKTYDIVLLEEAAGYVMAYFNGDRDAGQERGQLAWSRDGLHWQAIDAQGYEIESSLGSGRIRDPYLTRDKEGNFILLATQGFDNPEIYLMRTEDLVDFSDQKLIQVAWYDPGIALSGERAWAPMMIYDNENDQYLIAFSDNGFSSGNAEATGHIYGITSSDLDTFSAPFTLFDPGYTVIDGTIFAAFGKYWMFYKDERKAALTLFYAEAERLPDFEKAYDSLFLSPEKGLEGPFVLPALDGSCWYLYADYYGQATFRVAQFTKLGEDCDLTWLSQENFTLPEEDVRHGSALMVTEKELARLLDAHGLQP